jgi:cell division protein FtsB
MFTNINNSLSLLSLILTLCAILGGILAWRSGFNSTANAVQERVINALESEIAALRQRLEDVARENTRLDQMIETICLALKKRGLEVAIDGDVITITDNQGSSTITRIHI